MVIYKTILFSNIIQTKKRPIIFHRPLYRCYNLLHSTITEYHTLLYKMPPFLFGY